jgi:hypothetical protein
METLTTARKPDRAAMTPAIFLAGGGGVEYRIMPRLWVRADYEYQSWPDFFKSTVPAGRLNPQGFTVGAIYHFSRPRFH